MSDDLAAVVDDEAPLPAGDFASWLLATDRAGRDEQDAAVPCGGCTACCTSSQFVHIEPDETDTLAHIPKQLLFPAPMKPRGHLLLGYDERGHCPMLVDGACSIYEHRPRTCRTYDCRVFAAAAIDADRGDRAQASIARRARRWEFAFASDSDRVRREAVRHAARFLTEHPQECPGGVLPNPTGVAVLATQIRDAFLAPAAGGGLKVIDPEPGTVRAELRRREGQRKGS